MLLAFTLTIPAAFAEETTVSNGAEQSKPCKQIEQACSAAGFVKGGAKEGKGLYVHCIRPLLEGKSVAGVTVDAATIQACQEKREKK